MRLRPGFGFGFGNHVVIQSGGYQVVYAHMRTGSVRVAHGRHVTCGNVTDGSGFRAAAPERTCTSRRVRRRRLHDRVDPFGGDCSPAVAVG